MIDICICCGEIIPEGRFACYKCESGVNDAEGIYNRLISEITYKDNRPYGLSMYSLTNLLSDEEFYLLEKEGYIKFVGHHNCAPVYSIR